MTAKIDGVADRALAFPVPPLLDQISGFVARNERRPGDRDHSAADLGWMSAPAFPGSPGSFSKSLFDRDENGRACSAYARSREAKRIERLKTALFVIGILCV